MGRKGSDHVFNEVVHAAVGRPHLNLGIAGDLQHRQEEGQMLQQPTLQRPLLPAVQPVAPAAPHLTPEEAGGGLQFVLTFDDRVIGEGVLNERGGLPGLAPTPARIQHDRGRQLIHRGQGSVELRRLVEVGAGIDPIPLEGDVIRTQVTQLEHPGLDPERLGLLDRNPVGNDEIPVHEDVADATLLQQLAQERPPLLHRLLERHTDVGGEAEFPQREAHLGDRNAASLQVTAEASEEQPDGPHQQQDRSFNAHLHQCRRPSPAQIAVQHCIDPGTP